MSLRDVGAQEFRYGFLTSLVRLSVIGVAMLTLLLTGSQVLARHYWNAPDLPLQAMFTNADGSPCAMPCMFGIHPGMTELDNVLTTLRAHPLITQMNPKPAENQANEMFISLREYGITAFMRMVDDRVTTISFNIYGREPGIFPPEEQKIGRAVHYATLGDAIALWGAPDLVEIVRDRVTRDMYVSLCYKGRGFCIGFIGRPSNRVYSSLAFYSFYTNSAERMNTLLTNLEADRALFSWIGMTTLGRYRAQIQPRR